MPVSVEGELHSVLAQSVPVVNLLARVNEVLQTGLELLSGGVAGRALHGGTILVQEGQITLLVASEVGTVVGLVSRVSRLSGQRLALIEVGLLVALGNSGPVALNLLQLQHLVVRSSHELVLLLVLVTLSGVQILDGEGGGTVAADVVVTGVDAVTGVGGELVDQNQTVGLHGSVAQTHLAASSVELLSKLDLDESFLTGDSQRGGN